MNFFNILKVCALLRHYQEHANSYYKRVLNSMERYCIGLPRISLEAIKEDIKKALKTKSEYKGSGNPCNLLPALFQPDPLKIIDIDVVVVHCLVHGYRPTREPDWIYNKFKEFLKKIETEIALPKKTYFNLDYKIGVMAFDILSQHRWQELPALADRLQDNGVEDEDILDHLYNVKEHSYGCWAISACSKPLYDRLFRAISNTSDTKSKKVS